jgi:tRNA 2-thiouridine synthesizing protein B
MLHVVNKSPFERSSLESCLRHARPGSAVILIEDGVYGALRGTAFAPRLQQAMKNVKVYALQQDVEMRGMQSRVLDGVTLVDYAGFVDLVTEHPRVQSWL